MIYCSTLEAIAVLITVAVIAIVIVAYWSTRKIPRWHFKSSTVLITGGSTGIGLATAYELVNKHVLNLIIAARRKDVLIRATTELHEHALRINSSTKIYYVVMDVCDKNSVVAGIHAANEFVKPYRINLLICNAGFAHPARFMESTHEHAMAMMEVNYFGILRVLWEILPTMIDNTMKNSKYTTCMSSKYCAGHDANEAFANRVVLVSSMAALAPIAGYSLYAASKSAVRALAHSLDMELSWNKHNPVHVQVVSPPDVATPGYTTENTIKCSECAAISSFAGSKPFSPQEMAKAIVDGIEHYRFDITLGSDGYLLGLASSRMEPASNLGHLLMEVIFAGPVRLGLAIFARLHYNIVRKVRTDENDKQNTFNDSVSKEE